LAPVVSVVIPTFGRPALVVRAVNSVLAQTMAELEVIVVIDGVDAATVSAIGSVGDSRVRIISHDHQMGAGRTRDDGVDASLGQWVAFLDDDDEWLPNKLAGQLAVAEPKSIVICRTRVVTTQGDFVRPGKPYDDSIPFDEWLFDRTTWLSDAEGFLQTSSLLIPKQLFDEVSFTDTKQHEEWELVLRATKQFGYKLLTAPGVDVIYYAGTTTGSLSKSYKWMVSVSWADGLGALVTPRAYSGFCLVTVARMAASVRDYSAVPRLLRAAMSRGKPSAKQLFAFALVWLLPETLRGKIRSSITTQRG
jgi:glycosyltransferase involved in cell wall biosynthesis